MTFMYRLLQPAPTRQGHDEADRPGYDVAHEEHEQHQYGFRGYNDKEDYGKDKKAKRLALDQSRVLEGIILEIGDHQECQEVNK